MKYTIKNKVLSLLTYFFIFSFASFNALAKDLSLDHFIVTNYSDQVISTEIYRNENGNLLLERVISKQYHNEIKSHRLPLDGNEYVFIIFSNENNSRDKDSSVCEITAVPQSWIRVVNRAGEIFCSVESEDGLLESGEVSPATSLKTRIKGRVYLDSPLSNATIRLFDLDGRLIYEADDATNKNGFFIFDVKNGQTDFLVEASEGSYRGRSFEGKLLTQVRNYNVNNGAIHVNAPTTIASYVVEADPDGQLEESTAMVKKLLTIPESYSIEHDLNSSSKSIFSHRKFMKEATKSGGIEAFSRQLAQESLDSNTPRLFNEKLLKGMTGKPGRWVAEKIMGGMASKLGGSIFGWGMSEMGIDLFDDGQMAKLNEISSKLDMLTRDIKRLRDEMKQLIADLKFDVYTSAELHMVASVSRIQMTWNELSDLVHMTPGKPATIEEINRIRSHILEHTAEDMQLIHNSLMGLVGRGLIEMWDSTIKPRKYLDYRYYDKVEYQLDYYYNLQVSALALLAEAYHSYPENDERRKKVFSKADIFKSNTASQLPRYDAAGVPKPFGRDFVIDLEKKRMWWNRRYVGKCFNAGSIMAGNFNKSNYLGYSNWRHAKIADIDSLFADDLKKYTDGGYTYWKGAMDHLVNNVNIGPRSRSKSEGIWTLDLVVKPGYPTTKAGLVYFAKNPDATFFNYVTISGGKCNAFSYLIVRDY
jgi:hypothetical protein